jgi:Zn-dependent M28 family amino/carboxypeptidase
VRLVESREEGEDVVVEIDVTAHFYDDDPMAYNTIAEIPGTDLADEVVMAGAHLDSWHAGTGATDNGAGSAVVMEAARILQALGVRPRRTIRVALWSGEEQGLLGSRAYVAEHLASRPEPEDPEQKKLPEFLRRDRGPLTLKPEHAHFAAYFNLDNGSGKIRGIYAQENAGVVPVFEAWLRPFHDLGATTVTQNNTRGTDHLSFHRVGLPGFQFIQDPLDYFSRTHHTNADTLEHVVAADLEQASVIMASFLYHAAMRPEKLPRPLLPPNDEEHDEGRGNAEP